MQRLSDILQLLLYTDLSLLLVSYDLGKSIFFLIKLTDPEQTAHFCQYEKDEYCYSLQNVIVTQSKVDYYNKHVIPRKWE